MRAGGESVIGIASPSRHGRRDRFGSSCRSVRLVVWAATATAGFSAPTAAESTAESALLEQEAIRAAAAVVAPSTVRIEPLATAANAGQGTAAATTGLVVAAPGWVVTSSFGLPESAREAVVIAADGRRRAGRLRGRDTSRRLVLLEVEPADGLPLPRLVPDDPPAAGSWAIAVGRGWSAAAPGISVGIVSAAGRVWGRAIQTDAAVSPANYGGPLVDIRGRVFGILSPLPADTAGMTLGSELYDSGIGFAVPIRDVLAVLPRLQAGETLRPGILGISYASPDPFTAPAVVALSRSGSPASRAGLRPGDRIVSANGGSVDTIASFRQVIGPLYAGDRLALEVRRTGADGGAVTVPLEATLVDSLPPYQRPALGIALNRPVRATEPEQEPGKAPPKSPAGRPDRSGEKSATAAATVRWVWPESPAERAGIRAGDAILSIMVADRTAAGGDAGGGPTASDAATSPAGSVALLRGVVAGEDIGTRFRVSLRRGDAPLTLDVASAALPTGVPDAKWLPTRRPPPARRPDAPASIERLGAADVESPALAILPPADATEALGAVVVLGDPKATIDERSAEPWLRPAADHGVAVVIAQAADGSGWGSADVRSVAKALEILASRRGIDATRVAVAGLGAGAEAAWNVGASLAAVTRGIAVLEGHLPRRATIPEADPARPLSVLLSDFGPARGDVEAGRRGAADRKRLSEAAIPWGSLETRRAEWPAEEICRWVESLGLL
jgi:serine protease Do